MTYVVSGGTLNPAHSLTHSLPVQLFVREKKTFCSDGQFSTHCEWLTV